MLCIYCIETVGSSMTEDKLATNINNISAEMERELYVKCLYGSNKLNLAADMYILFCKIMSKRTTCKISKNRSMCTTSKA